MPRERGNAGDRESETQEARNEGKRKFGRTVSLWSTNDPSRRKTQNPSLRVLRIVRRPWPLSVGSLDALRTPASTIPPRTHQGDPGHQRYYPRSAGSQRPTASGCTEAIPRKPRPRSPINLSVPYRVVPAILSRYLSSAIETMAIPYRGETQEDRGGGNVKPAGEKTQETEAAAKGKEAPGRWKTQSSIPRRSKAKRGSVYPSPQCPSEYR
jgi:hypothetical protein